MPILPLSHTNVAVNVFSLYNASMDDDGYYYSREDAIAAYLYTQARIKAVEKKAIKRLSMTEDDKKFFEQLKSEINNEDLYKQLYRYYLSSDITTDDIKKVIE